MNSLLGAMQGRFTNKGGFFPQEFPWKNWKEEFWTAGKYNVDCLEWMFNAERFDENPIWTDSGRLEIKNIVSESGVAVNSICANYFMQYSIKEEKNSLSIISRLVEAAEMLGIHQIIIPLFGASEILGVELICELFGKICGKLSQSQVYIGFESDLPAMVQKSICDTLHTNKIGICYDVGNATGNGHESAQDVLVISESLLEIHLKDKYPDGGSVMLGDGAVDFESIFQNMKNWDKGVYILESYFGRDAERDTVKNIQYIREKMNG